jgi:hypothetical protein
MISQGLVGEESLVARRGPLRVNLSGRGHYGKSLRLPAQKGAATCAESRQGLKAKCLNSRFRLGLADHRPTQAQGDLRYLLPSPCYGGRLPCAGKQPAGDKGDAQEDGETDDVPAVVNSESVERLDEEIVEAEVREKRREDTGPRAARGCNGEGEEEKEEADVEEADATCRLRQACREHGGTGAGGDYAATGAPPVSGTHI